jgi:signal peptidase II
VRVSASNKIFLMLVVLASCVGCDQATKRLAEFALKNTRPRTFLGNTFRLEYAENTGAFLGLGAGLPDWQRWALLTVASSAILAALLAFVCLRKDLRTLDICGYALILAGGISNMIDRVLAGAVVDFMNIGIGGLRTGIFNVADMAIMAGLFVVIWAHVGESRRASAPIPASAGGPPP